MANCLTCPQGQTHFQDAVSGITLIDTCSRFTHQLTFRASHLGMHTETDVAGRVLEDEPFTHTYWLLKLR